MAKKCAMDIVIAAAVRTPIGNFGGSLKDISAVDLGAIVCKEAMERAKITPDMVDEVIFGNVLQAGLGQNVARQVSVKAGVPYEVPSFTVNKVCGSGLKAVHLAYQSIMSYNDHDIVLCGGTENMSQAPYLLSKARWGQRMGNGELVDEMITDGLWDAFNDYHMGVTAENVAELYNISREEQDEFALGSQQKAEAAIKAGKFKDEIVPVEIPQRKGDPIVMEQDEFPRFGATIESLQKLRPAFKKGGSVTAGNASGINDGAAAFVIMTEEKAKELGVEPLGKIVAFGQMGVKPEIMGTGPIPATRQALKNIGWTVEDLELIEANEAFSAQALAVTKELKFNPDIVNVNGGAIALGHPIGCSGSRVLVTLLHEMKKRDVHKGLATLCIGGGQGIALCVER